jgi:hypothetical protein
MANQKGIAIVIKAFLPTGTTLDEQFNALSIVKTAHETGDYAPVLAAAQIDEVKAEQKTRRVDDEQPSGDESQGDGKDQDTKPDDTKPNASGEQKYDADAPEFIKGKKGKQTEPA